MLSLCCCTCCCAVEQKHISPPPGRTESGQDHRNQDARSSTDQSQTRFVIKLPGIGKVPIYGPVGPLTRTDGAGTSRPANDGYEFDDGNQNGRSTAGYVNESFPTSSRGPRLDTADPFENGPSRVVDSNDGQSYGYDPSPQRVARPAPNPPLPPKPKTTATIPKLSRNEFLEMQVEMNKIKDKFNQNERYIDDSEVYGFDSPPAS